MESLISKIEAVLFFKAEPVSIKELEQLFSVSREEIERAASILRRNLEGHGIVLVFANDVLELTTAADTSEFIETLQRDELRKDLGKAGLETLTIILYYGPLSRAEIDHIRGVNSSYTLRHLMVRGLIERLHGRGGGGFLYRSTNELMHYLGISEKEQMPEYETVRQEIESFIQRTKGDKNDEQT